MNFRKKSVAHERSVAMDAEKLIAFVVSQGYTNVKVDIYKKGFRVRYSASEYNIAHYYNFPISELPSKPDGSKRYQRLLNAFPFLPKAASNYECILAKQK